MMKQCMHCDGFLPKQVDVCPHCDQKLSVPTWQKMSRRNRWVTMAGAGALAFTLMACYGGPPGAFVPPCNPVDKDQDGYFACEDGRPYDGTLAADGGGSVKGDCDDLDAKVHPGAADKAGDGVDQNCDGFDNDAAATP